MQQSNPHLEQIMAGVMLPGLERIEAGCQLGALVPRQARTHGTRQPRQRLLLRAVPHGVAG